MGNKSHGKAVKQVELRITVDVPVDHDEKTLVGYVVGGMRADRNLSCVRFLDWDAIELTGETQERRYRNRLEMTMIALNHAVSRYEMSARARDWHLAEMANIRKVLGSTEETR